MPLEIHTFPLGPMSNNTYVLVDPFTRNCVFIDPTFNSQHIMPEIKKNGWLPTQIWLTHAHFDHTAGILEIRAVVDSDLPVGIHPQDLELYHAGGGADIFGITPPILPEPAILFEHEQILTIGTKPVEVRHTPGHSPGHVIFYLPDNSTALVGDLIFKNGVGRTDLSGGSMSRLLKSIYTSVITLPPETRLLSGHGPETTVADEKEYNPYLA